MALITCSNVSLSYDGQTIISGLSFEVIKGDYLCIVGENGSGKSTLISGLLGLKKCSSGQIEMGDGLLQSDIGYLPQQTSIQKNFPASVFEVVLSGCLNKKKHFPFYAKEDREKALENMDRLNISRLKNSCYKDLSGGQQQRVLLARTLCAAKKVLVLDEPVTGLDPIVSAEFYQLIHSINRDSEIAIIMVSHDIQSAVEHSTMVLHLDQKPLFFGKVEEYTKSDLGKKFLGGGRNA